MLASRQIAHALGNHEAKVTVFVLHYAMSGGTLLALAADETVMDPNAVLGPVDPQLNQYPAASIIKAVAQELFPQPKQKAPSVQYIPVPARQSTQREREH